MLKTIKSIIIEHILYRKQIVKLAKAEVIKTYTNTALGWSWAIIKPMTTIFMFWFAFAIGLRYSRIIEGHPYFLWLIAGFMPWFYMQEMIQGGASCIRANRALVTKMKFPISVIPTYFSLSKLVVNLGLTLIMVIIYICMGFMPTIYYLQLPLYIFMMYIWFTIWALFAGMLSAVSADFLNLVKSFGRAIFWISGVMYDVRNIRTDWIRIIMGYNPITIIVNGFRDTFIYHRWFFEDTEAIRNYLILLIIIMVLAINTFRHRENEIRDIL